MSEPLWTPGPWYNDGEDELIDGIPMIEIAADKERGSRAICYVDSTLRHDVYELTNEDYANAALIAAAPDEDAALLGLLNRYLSLANSGDCGFWDPEEEPEVMAARAALAKARGES